MLIASLTHAGDLLDPTKEPAAVSKFGELGFEVVANSNQEFAAYLVAEMARWKDVIEKGGIQAE